MKSDKLERKFIELQHAIQQNDGVECSQSPDFFFPEDWYPSQRKMLIEVAKSICAPCPVRELCLDYGKSANMIGIWGGTTAEERKAIQSES